MPNKKHPGSIYRRASCNRLIIEYRGEKISTGLPDSKENRKIAEQMIWTLWRRDHGMEPIDTTRIVQQLTTPDEAWDEYEQFLKTADRSVKTIQAYRDAYRKMRPMKLSEKEIEDAVQQFIRSWKGKPSSVNIHLRNYEAFLHWCIKKRYLVDAPQLKSYKRRGVEKEVQVLSAEEIERTIVVLQSKKDHDLADLVQIMYLTGLRISEALRLGSNSIVNIDSVLVIRLANKTNKRPEYIPISDKVHAILKPRINQERFFPWQLSSTSKLTRRFNAALRAAGITGKTGFHILRKSFRHRLQIAGVPVDAARRLMRHSSLRVTDQHYTFYDATSLAKILDDIK